MKKTSPRKPKSLSKTSNDLVKSDELVKRTPDENKQYLLAQSKFHRGPLPAPEDLLRYEQICPGAADRIIRMAEKEQKSLQKFRLKEYRSLRMGIILGFISFMFLIALVFSAIYLDKPWVAAVLVAGMSTCSLFIKKKIINNDNE